jgi:fused signal recognition particle receptor
MIKWFKRSHDTRVAEPERSKNTTDSLPEPPQVAALEQEPSGIFARFRKSLSKTRHQLGDGIGRLLLGKKEISQDLLDELETLLISADLGMETTQEVLKQLVDGLARKQLSDGNAVYDALKSHLLAILNKNSQPLILENADHSPFVILMVGVNGAGKTTTIGKLAKQFQQQGKKVMLAAGDTFRAAAVEQLHVWGERNDISVIAQHTGADSASVIFDALQAAKARKMDVLIADTAGRLHTQGNLMEELKKVKRVLQKLCAEAPHETMLILDASIGQNALVQARQFHEAVGLTGITMTKLDGTAKGGILFAIANELGIPFRYIGIGEGIEDLRPFDAAQFVGALFNDHI